MNTNKLRRPRQENKIESRKRVLIRMMSAEPFKGFKWKELRTFLGCSDHALQRVIEKLDAEDRISIIGESKSRLYRLSEDPKGLVSFFKARMAFLEDLKRFVKSGQLKLEMRGIKALVEKYDKDGLPNDPSDISYLSVFIGMLETAGFNSVNLSGLAFPIVTKDIDALRQTTAAQIANVEEFKY